MLPVYIDIVKQGGVRRKRTILKLKYKLVGRRQTPPIELRARRLSNHGIFYLVSIFIYFGALYSFEMDGRVQAQKALEDHLSESSKSGQMITVKINEKMESLRILACGSSNCAGIAKNSNEIYYFPITNGFSYVLK